MKFVIYAQGVRSEVLDHILDASDGDAVAAKAADFETSVADADGIILQDFVWAPELLAIARKCPRLKWIQLLTSGYDKLSQFGAPEGVTICNARGAFSHSVAVHAVTLYLALLRGVPTMLKQQESNSWQRDFANVLTVPKESNVAIVGFGSIGQEIAKLLRPFGPHITGISRTGAHSDLADEIVASDRAKIALAAADAIFLCMPLDSGTRHTVDYAALKAFRRNAVIINVGRGGLWDQYALAQALREGLIAGAATDVTEPEPLGQDHPLWSAPNFILSPHVSGASGEVGYKSQAQIAIDNLDRIRRGEPVENVITL